MEGKSRKHSTVKELFRMPFFTLSYVLAWPTKERSKAQRVLGFVHFQYYVWFAVACFVKVYWTLQDFDVLLFADSLTPGMTVFATMVRLQIFVRQHREFYDILNELEEIITSKDFHPRATEVNQRKSKLLFKVNAFNFSLPNLTGVGYFLLPLLINIYKAIFGIPIILKLPIWSSWPWDVTTAPGYAVSYLYMAYNCYCLPAAFAGIDNTVMNIMFYTGTLFDSIVFDLEDLGRQIRDDVMSERDPNPAASEVLKALVDKHERANEFSRRVEALVTPLTIIQFIIAAIQICFGNFMILATSDIVSKVTYICYFSTVLSQAFSYCWGGNDLYFSSTNLAMTFYDFPWIELNAGNRKKLILMMSNAQRGVGVSVPFFRVNLPTFIGILRASGSYLALLNTFMNKK